MQRLFGIIGVVLFLATTIALADSADSPKWSSYLKHMKAEDYDDAFKILEDFLREKPVYLRDGLYVYDSHLKAYDAITKHESLSNRYFKKYSDVKKETAASPLYFLTTDGIANTKKTVHEAYENKKYDEALIAAEKLLQAEVLSAEETTDYQVIRAILIKKLGFSGKGKNDGSLAIFSKYRENFFRRSLVLGKEALQLTHLDALFEESSPEKAPPETYATWLARRHFSGRLADRQMVQEESYRIGKAGIILPVTWHKIMLFIGTGCRRDNDRFETGLGGCIDKKNNIIYNPHMSRIGADFWEAAFNLCNTKIENLSYHLATKAELEKVSKDDALTEQLGLADKRLWALELAYRTVKGEQKEDESPRTTVSFIISSTVEFPKYPDKQGNPAYVCRQKLTDKVYYCPVSYLEEKNEAPNLALTNKLYVNNKNGMSLIQVPIELKPHYFLNHGICINGDVPAN